MNLSFFTHGGGSGKIRGEQIATYLGAKLNPTSRFENDICIYVKCVPPRNYPKHSYVDVVEDSAGLRWVKSNPDIGIIASSKSIYDYLSNKLLANRIVFIPQHHCNFERVLRTRKEVKIAGIIGNNVSFQYPLGELEAGLNRIGIELKTLIKKRFDSREEVVDFYKQIDIQLVWRPGSNGVLRNPLKLINAMSFGIPTVAWPEKDFVEELEGCFIEASSIELFLTYVQELQRDNDLYKTIYNLGLERSKYYHIDNISKLYLKLE